MTDVSDRTIKNRWLMSWHRMNAAIEKGKLEEADKEAEAWSDADHELRGRLKDADYEAFTGEIAPKDGRWVQAVGP